MEEKKTWYKHPIVVMSLILVALIVIILFAMASSSDDTNTKITTEKNSTLDDNEDYSDISSSNNSESYSSINQFSNDSQKSLANIKADVSTMPKENYDNVENEVLNKADFDPTGDNSSASYQIDAIMNSLKNVQKLADDAKKLSEKPDSDYTEADKNKLTNYSNVLNDYLLGFKDYATIIYQDKYTSEDPSTSQSDKQLLVDEMNAAKNTWTDKKNKWLEQYNYILGQ